MTCLSSNTSITDPISASELTKMTVELGRQLLLCGAEIYRVEDTMLRIFRAYEISDCDVYVLPNAIFASITQNASSFRSSCHFKRVPVRDTINLFQMMFLNQLARDICNHQCSKEEIWARLSRDFYTYPTYISIFSCGIGTASFCYLFGGSLCDTICAFFIGLIEQVILFFFEVKQVSSMLSYVFTSIYITLTSILLQSSSLPASADTIIIGSIMPMVPGITFTTSIRDFYNSDYLSGTIHLINALLTALCIAAGVAISIYFVTALS
jgi:uncharacterized membrane protein YjjP (DUF1212 family)